MRWILIFGVLALTALTFFLAVQSLPTTYNAQASANITAEAEAAAAAQVEAARAGFAEEAAALTTKISDLEAESAGKTSDLEAALAEQGQLKSAIEQTTLHLTAMEAELASLETDNSDLTEALAVLEANQEDTSGETDTIIQSLNDEVAKGRDVVQVLQAKIVELESDAAVPTVSAAASCQEKTDVLMTETRISFDSGAATITAESVPLLEELASIASDCVQEDVILVIEGHTDNAGGEASNLLLSNGRAKAIRAFLEERGVAGSSMRALGFGESDPIADNDTSEGQARNRRIVFDWQQR